MQYRVDENTIWEDTGKIKVHNYPASSGCTYSYITRVYREIKKDSFGWKEVDGEPVYFHEMTSEQIALAVIMANAESTLDKTCMREKFLVPIKRTVPKRE